MNTTKIREVCNKLMMIGGIMFTGGLGGTIVCNYVDSSKIKKEKKALLAESEINHEKEMQRLKQLRIEQETKESKIRTDQISKMNSKEFEKFYATECAKASDEAIAKAEEIKRIAESDLTKAKLECEERIAKVEAECLKKIQEANAQRDKAKEDYEHIDNLFTNKDAVLRAKEELENSARLQSLANSKDLATKESIVELLGKLN